MTKKAKPERRDVSDLAESYHNGNKGEVFAYLHSLPVADALCVAFRIYERLRGGYGAGEARYFGYSAESRAESPYLDDSPGGESCRGGAS